MSDGREAREAALVLVGIDDSEPSRAALRWAADYARATGAHLLALHVRDVGQDQSSPGQAWSAGFAFVDPGDAGDPMRPVELMFAEIGPDPGWRLSVVDGAAGPELIRASAAADLLVVGTHEHTGFGRLVIGSVSHFCLTHTSKPVVAVPPQ